jgi:hypothetical protein
MYAGILQAEAESTGRNLPIFIPPVSFSTYAVIPTIRNLAIISGACIFSTAINIITASIFE